MDPGKSVRLPPRGWGRFEVRSDRNEKGATENTSEEESSGDVR